MKIGSTCSLFVLITIIKVLSGRESYGVERHFQQYFKVLSDIYLYLFVLL